MSADDGNTDAVESFALPGSVPPELVEETEEVITGVSEGEEDEVVAERPSTGITPAIIEEQSEDEKKTSKTEKVVEIPKKMSPTAAAATSSSSNDASGNNKGAQILMNRFSTWRTNANLTKISSNAQSVFAKGATLFPRGTNNATSGGHAGGGDDEMSSSHHSSSLLEEEGHITTDDDGLRQHTQSDDESVSSIGSSMDGDVTDDNNNMNAQERAASAALMAQTAASVVAESVSASFRGRYSSGGTDNDTIEENNKKAIKSETMRQSQTALIMQSRAAKHMQSILDSLKPDEFVMLLGRGPLGVNLKQTFLKNNGVYLDYYVKGSAAEASGVTYAGDSLVKVGDVDVRKGTVKDVPETIGAAKRPCVLVFTTKHFVMQNMTYVDVAVGMMHKIREDSNENHDIASMPLSEKEDDKDDEMASPKKEDSDQKEESDIDPKMLTIPPHSFHVSDCVNPPLPSAEVKKYWANHAAKRCNDDFSVTMMSHAASNDANFRAALRNAFVTCAMDGRRLPFLARFLASEDESYKIGESSSPDNEGDDQNSASKQLILFLDLMSYADLYGVAPACRRRDIAKRIAFKFFLPSTLDGETTYPMFDFHHIVPDSELRSLEQALNDTTRPIEQTIFDPFRDATVDLLSGPTFISFMVSDDCSRMRAYLRNTAPYTHVSLRKVFDGITSSNADSLKGSVAGTHLSFIMMHSLCMTENGVGTENDDIIYGKGKRLSDVSAGMACAIFIQRDLVVSLNTVRESHNGGGEEASQKNTKAIGDLMNALSRLWEVFVAPDIGALESLSHSNETDAALDALRILIRQQIMTTYDKAKTLEEVIDSIIKSDLDDALSRLSDELLYDYATNTLSKYREDKMHEWMCIESSKQASLSSEEKKDDVLTEGEFPILPDDCIRRVLRKLELPDGVSLHKPQRMIKQSSGDESLAHAVTDAPGKPRENRNADFAIVFGTDDGLNKDNRITNPAMDNQDIRRYICEPVAVDGAAVSSKQLVPATLESYACVFPYTNKPFAQVADSSRLSSDGWEVALINFMIPNADASSGDGENGSIFGVSLVLTKPYEGLSSNGGTNKRVAMELVQGEATEDGSKSSETSEKVGETVVDSDGKAIGAAPFASPLIFSHQKAESIGDSFTSMRQIRVSSETPNFNSRLKGTPWSERATKEDCSITVGIALVSQKNSILAMRSTLSRLLFDHSRSVSVDGKEDEDNDASVSQLVCGPLADLLGNFSHEDIESVALKCVLEPYLRFGSSPWLDQPLIKQSTEFMLCAGMQLLQSLPPVPLALLFVSALLEQKIVFSSSRRSLLLSATCGLTELLQPLKWSHLLVPLAPSALATDLVQYPAPFILGIPSEDPGSMDLLNSLPEDVTLVDLDVGRVILARSFAFDDGLVRGETDEQTTARALRSQVLYLAQSLGVLFGACLQQQTWCCDSPSVTFPQSQALRHTTTTTDFERLKLLSKSFINEILEGAPFCCFWVEENKTDAEASMKEGNILFDEDRFFDIKNGRAEGLYQPLFSKRDCLEVLPSDESEERESSSKLALSLRDFDLVLESFLRCQSMSTFISSCPKKSMVYY